jgi:tRNA dimethylallyltransferase
MSTADSLPHSVKSKNLLVVCGPTASGKTALGVALARQLDGEIISADSRHIYRGMDIGTGKDLGEYGTGSQTVPHHCIDIADPGELYTVYQYKRDFNEAFEQIRCRGKLPVMVGGTGLYIEAVLKNYTIPEVPENAALRAELMKSGKDRLAQELLRINEPLYKRTDLSSRKRIVRALEIAGSNPSSLPDQSTPSDIDPLVLCVVWDRPVLRERIDKRVDQRLKQGMVEEVRRLLDSGIDPHRFALFGMEYKHIARFLKGEVAFDKMVSDLKNDIHHLAKRQETWFRGMERRGVAVHWVPQAKLEAACKVIQEF